MISMPVDSAAGSLTAESDVASRRTQAPAAVNALGVDVEEWFQAPLFRPTIPRNEWDQLSSGVERDTNAILALLGEHDARATFFVFGWIAERHPDLVRCIAAQGHEIACRGYDARPIERMSEGAFLSDLISAKAILEDIAGEEVTGYRAPIAALGPSNPWVYSMLAEAGFRYSASTNPGWRKGRRAQPPAPFPHVASSGIVEVPSASLPLSGRRWPGPSGPLLRLLPYAGSRWMMHRLNAVEHSNVVFGCSSWEFDASTPQVAGRLSVGRLAHYAGRRHMRARFARLLCETRWSRLDDVFSSNIRAAAQVPAVATGLAVLRPTASDVIITGVQGDFAFAHTRKA